MRRLTPEKRAWVNKAARDKIRESENRRLKEEIPRFLLEHGPTEFAELTEALHSTRGRMVMAGKELESSGEIYRYRICPNRDSRRIWSITAPPKREPRPVRPVKMVEIGMDPEDLAWMENQRRSAEERKARHERMAHW